MKTQSKTTGNPMEISPRCCQSSHNNFASFRPIKLFGLTDSTIWEFSLQFSIISTETVRGPHPCFMGWSLTKLVDSSFKLFDLTNSAIGAFNLWFSKIYKDFASPLSCLALKSIKTKNKIVPLESVSGPPTSPTNKIDFDERKINCIFIFFFFFFSSIQNT